MATVLQQIWRRKSIRIHNALPRIVKYTRSSRVRMCVIIFIFCTLVSWNAVEYVCKAGRYSIWTPKSLGPRSDYSSKNFVLSRDAEIYMYSAFINRHYPYPGEANIVISTMDASQTSLQCCVLFDKKTLYTTEAQSYFFYHNIDVTIVAMFVEFFLAYIYYARQYACLMPDIGHSVVHATLASFSCSPDISDYLPVSVPEEAPGSLGLCAKIAHSGGLDPEKVIEWFEVQRLLGVDKIILYDMGNPDYLTRVFRYYQNLGILDLQPYDLPGYPKNRTLNEKVKSTLQFHNDESLSVLECRQRLGGYTFVMSHDVDEFIIPKRDITLKQFFKDKMKTYPDSAGFYFKTKFFIYDWGPSHPEEDMMLTRHRKATIARRERTKYVFLPKRVISAQTHDIHQLPSYSTYRLDINDAVLHHYRHCPSDAWPHCHPETALDHSMTRFRDLYKRVLKVREATSTKPRWTPETRTPGFLNNANYFR